MSMIIKSSSLAECLKPVENVHLTLNASVSSLTSMEVGGPARYLIEPDDEESLVNVIGILNDCDIPWMMLGSGTNTIFTDRGFKGALIRIGPSFRYVNFEEDGIVRTGASTLLSSVTAASCRKGCTGLEFCYGIPGTVGGAVAGNAGSDGLGIHDRVVRIHGVTSGGEKRTALPGDYSYGYRCVSDLDMVVTHVELKLRSADRDICKQRVMKYKHMRSRQPAKRGVSGSIFKNPPGDFAGRMIDVAGMKGYRIGGAQVSRRHANWIVNTGRAKASDVLALIECCRSAVKYHFATVLEPEVKIINASGF